MRKAGVLWDHERAGRLLLLICKQGLYRLGCMRFQSSYKLFLGTLCRYELLLCKVRLR
jgi:hypothetical protein